MAWPARSASNTSMEALSPTSPRASWNEQLPRRGLPKRLRKTPPKRTRRPSRIATKSRSGRNKLRLAHFKHHLNRLSGLHQLQATLKLDQRQMMRHDRLQVEPSRQEKIFDLIPRLEHL